MPAGLLRWLWLLFLAPACAPEIGDECETAFDCSSQASRLCDRTQPGGYCTIRGCESGTCPEEAVCVKFRAQEERLSVTYCMAKCEDDADCRSNEGYRCTSAAAFGSPGEAVILGRATRKFCSIPLVAGSEPPSVLACGEPGDASLDAGLSDVDAACASDAH